MPLVPILIWSAVGGGGLILGKTFLGGVEDTADSLTTLAIVSGAVIVGVYTVKKLSG